MCFLFYKGKILDTISKHWAARIEEWGYKTDLVKDHGLNFNSLAAITVREPLETLPIEFVVRRYLTGTTDTSLSSRYFKDEAVDFISKKAGEDSQFNQALDKDLMRNIARAKSGEFSAWKAENQDIIKKNKTKTAEKEYQSYRSQFFIDADVQKLANGYLHILKTITGKDLNLKKD